MSLLEPTAENRLVGFNVSYTLNGLFTANANFADPDCNELSAITDDCDFSLCGRNIQLYVDAELSADCCPVDELNPELVECFQDPDDPAQTYSPIWVNGLINRYQRTDGCSRIGITSLFEYLTTKPINSTHFNQSLESAILEIAEGYSGIPDQSFCLNSIRLGLPLNVPVEGNNTLSELSLLAQAGCANLFTQVGGCLTVELWKDHNDPTEFNIPHVIDTEPAGYTIPNTTAVRVRGGSISTTECGEQVLSEDSQGNPGPTTKCGFSGIKTSCLNYKFTGLKGEMEDLNNATITSQGIDTTGNITEITDGGFNAGYEPQGGAPFAAGAIQCNQFLVTGTTQSQQDEANSFSFGAQNFNGSGQFGIQQLTGLVSGGLFGFPTPFFSVGGGPFSQNILRNNVGSLQTNQSDGNFSDQPSRTQCEAITYSGVDCDDVCGINVEDVNNPYITYKEQLFKLGIRRFQEIKMAQRTWNVEMPYYPCLKINQMVEFDVRQDSDTCPPIRIKGIVGGINMDTEREPLCMRVAISDVQCLGQDTYTSSNLIPPICGGSGATGPFLSAATGEEQTSSADNGCLYLEIIGNGSAFVEYTHKGQMFDPDCSYLFSYEWEIVSGSGTLSIDEPTGPNVIGATTAGGVMSGTENSVFSGTTPIGTIRWFLLPANNNNPSEPLAFKISNIQLIASCVA